MRTLLLSFTFSMISVFTFGQQQPAAKGGNAQISFEKETHDYGTISQGADGNYEFKFKNTGKEPLVITNARASCGCTTPVWPKEPIKPGASGVIKVGYDTKRVGAFTKTITISSNSKAPETMLTIKGIVNAVQPEETFPAKKAEGAMPLEKQ